MNRDTIQMGIGMAAMLALTLAAFTVMPSCFGCGGLQFSEDVTAEQKAEIEAKMLDAVNKLIYATVGVVVAAVLGSIGWNHRDEIRRWFV